MTKLETKLDQLTDGLRAAVRHQQQDSDPAHEDFYRWGWALDELTRHTGDVGGVLERQVAAYGDRRILRDDEGQIPAARLQEARSYLVEMQAALNVANAAARRYHSAIGHIGVEVDPDADGGE